MKKPRDESQILNDLGALATSPGYIHAVAFMCHRDSFIHIEGYLKPSDMDWLFSRERLIRTELNTVIGLMAKKPLDLSLQPLEVIQRYVRHTEALMQEIHEAMSYPSFAAMLEAMQSGDKSSQPWHGTGMREPIFYGTESAYTFQYRDLLPEKYGADDEWLSRVKGFTSVQGKTIAKAMCALMDEKGTQLFSEQSKRKVPPPTWLPVFEFSVNEVVQASGLAQDIVEAFFRAFLYTGNNAAFKEVGDFNEISARPLLLTNRGTVLLFSQYAICEALYESPFYWMWDDKSYQPTASNNRGIFTEQFAARRLAGVFGKQHVHVNVNLHRGKCIVGEADVLVIYGDRLIIVQAKSKKLTLAARKGNDNQLKKDFAAAIQDSYDQGWICANEILDGQCRLVDDKENEISLPSKIKEIFLFCLVAEHYPALAFQANQFLNFSASDVIKYPFIMDVFLLDTMTEMLSTPLRLLNYVKLRAAASDKLMSSHELVVLAYHLKKNLLSHEDYDMVMLDDTITIELDSAMLVRRDNQPGDDTPSGILAAMRGSRYEQVIRGIEAIPVPALLELGFHLLSMDSSSCMNVHRILDDLIRTTQIDGNRHDMTLASSAPPGGVTFHCNPTQSFEAIAVLETHCTKRKYQQRAAKWFGISVSPEGNVQFGINLDYPWVFSAKLDHETSGMKPFSLVRDVLKSQPKYKIGRNDPCHCGSGNKYKKCCMS